VSSALAADPYLAATAELLWPAPARARIERRRGRPAPAAADYVILPSAERPKLVVPSRPRRVAAGAMRNFKTAAERGQQLRMGVLALGMRIGLHDLMPDRVVVRSPDADGIDAHLAAVLGRPVWIALYIGPARSVRKPVLQILDERGDTFAFAKLGVDEFTCDLVRAEAAAVRTVRAAKRTALGVPEVLHTGRWHGHEVLVQSALPHGVAVPAEDPLLRRAMRELALAGEPRRGPLRDSPYWGRLSEQLRQLPPSPATRVLHRALSAVDTAHGEDVLEFGCAHGDWAPWNMTVAGDRALVWDWEKFRTDAPVGFDLVHYRVQGDVVLGGARPADAFAATATTARALLAGLAEPAAAELLVRLYAIDIATRYLVDREHEAGHTRMADLGSWLGHVLGEDG